MSQLTQDSPQGGVKRALHAMAASPPRGRPRKRRNVVESSPLIEPSVQGDDVDTKEPDEMLDQIIDTQLEQLDDVRLDDPSFDWRRIRAQSNEAQECEEEDVDSASETDVIPETQGLQVPAELLEAEVMAMGQPPMTPGDHAVHIVYRTFLADLCSQTNTQSAEQSTVEGLPWVLCRNRSIGLDKDLRGHRETDVYAHAVVIHVWLVICFRIQQGIPPPDSTLVLQMSSYFLSAHAIMQQKVHVQYEHLRMAVEYWEQRPIALRIRSPWRSESWFQALPQPEMPTFRHRNATADAYLEALARGGKAELAAEIITKDQQSPYRTPLRQFTQGAHTNLEWALEELIGILAAMNTEVVKALIDGSLTRQAELSHSEVSNALETLRDQQPIPPAIYMNSICDPLGVSPTPLQWLTICDLMILYVSVGRESDDLAIVVDQLIHPEDKWPTRLAKKGLRRYTEWRTFVESDGDQYPNDSHRQMVKYFAAEMRARVDKEIEAGQSYSPLEAPVIEIGFSIDWRKRLREHRHHQSSNYLMNLAEALFKHAFPGSFRLQQLVIYNCYQPLQCWFSEIILTQLGQGYTDAGGGFSHYPAGRSNGTAYKMTGKADWVNFQYEAARSGKLEEELKKIALEAQRSEMAAIDREKHTKEAHNEEEMFLQGLNDALEGVLEWSMAETGK